MGIRSLKDKLLTRVEGDRVPRHVSTNEHKIVRERTGSKTHGSLSHIHFRSGIPYSRHGTKQAC